jgi:Holliday junction resolvase RusA-like endonuclease
VTGIIIELPGLPRGKGRPRFSRRTGRAYTDAKTESFEGALRTVGAVAMMKRGRVLFEGPLMMIMTAIFPVPESWSNKKRTEALAGHVFPTSKPDLDNLLKAAADGLNAIVYRDDAQIVEAVVKKAYGNHVGLTIEVRPIGINGE